MSYHIMACHIISYHIMAYHIMSWHDMSYHIRSNLWFYNKSNPTTAAQPILDPAEHSLAIEKLYRTRADKLFREKQGEPHERTHNTWADSRHMFSDSRLQRASNHTSLRTQETRFVSPTKQEPKAWLVKAWVSVCSSAPPQQRYGVWSFTTAATKDKEIHWCDR